MNCQPIRDIVKAPQDCYALLRRIAALPHKGKMFSLCGEFQRIDVFALKIAA